MYEVLYLLLDTYVDWFSAVILKLYNSFHMYLFIIIIHIPHHTYLPQLFKWDDQHTYFLPSCMVVGRICSIDSNIQRMTRRWFSGWGGAALLLVQAQEVSYQYPDNQLCTQFSTISYIKNISQWDQLKYWHHCTKCTEVLHKSENRRKKIKNMANIIKRWQTWQEPLAFWRYPPCWEKRTHKDILHCDVNGCLSRIFMLDIVNTL